MIATDAIWAVCFVLAVAATAFLKPALRRANLTVRPKSLVSQLQLKGNRVTGVEFIAAGQKHNVAAAQEVIVCAGAINSPQLLLLSGIGPPEDLRNLGIARKVSVPGVGKNLQDHVRISLRHQSKIPTPPGHLMALDGGLFVRSRDGLASAAPDLQFWIAQFDGDVINQKLKGVPLSSYTVVLTQPQSQGQISLRSNNALDKPRITANSVHLRNVLRTPTLLTT